MIKINKDKNIGKVLLIVEGERTEFYLLRKIFTQIFDYQYEKMDRMRKYKKYNEKDGIHSSIFVINAKDPAISTIHTQEDFLDEIFEKLIVEYQFPVDRAAIFYVFDRDVRSNTDAVLIRNLLRNLSSSRDSNDFDRQGLLLLSYPSIESFVASNFMEDSFRLTFETGKELKQYLDSNRMNQSKITEQTLLKAVSEMLSGMQHLGVTEYSIDQFSDTNLFIFNQQEEFYITKQQYQLLSLLSMILLDLGLVEIIEGQ
ncbi:hypothetical protein [Paenibacillus xylanexedens]|uniref:hypothetical protein n=1 Tax=Paenibacillus xylanexedens TaxID=528191 RepID=UPI0011A7624C|nr:hypothetical protein [Paenibacillus xylanexedens]